MKSLRFGLSSFAIALFVLSANAQTPTKNSKANLKDKKSAASATVIAPVVVNPVSLTADGLGAKAHLEELLARRYGQELSTLVDKSIFAISAQLDLIEVAPKVPEAPKEKPEDALPMDLR
ncbi:MAG: hypothetical protein ABIO95_00850, partial [Bdellovibrionota bacterium]